MLLITDVHRHAGLTGPKKGGNSMFRRTMLVVLCAAFVLALAWVGNAQAQQAFDRQWGGGYTPQDWNRFYHYPYVYYPQNFWGSDYYRSSTASIIAIRPRCKSPSTTRAGTTNIRSPAAITRGTISSSTCFDQRPAGIQGSGFTRGTPDPDCVSCQTAAGKRGPGTLRVPFAGTALRVLRTYGDSPLFPLPGDATLLRCETCGATWLTMPVPAPRMSRE